MVESVLFRPRAVNVFIFTLLTVLCFYLYAGFQTFYYYTTQDYIPAYVGAKYILSNPAFAFIIDYPHFYPLYYLYLIIVPLVTNDIQWLNVVVSLFIHIINAFVIFRISQILCKNRIFPSMMASLFFLVSPVYVDSLLCFPHSYPVISSFFGLLSLYYFFKTIESKKYKRLDLFLSIIYYLISVSCSENYIGLFIFYFLVMLLRTKQFKKDFAYAFFIVVFFFIIRFILREFLHKTYSLELALLNFTPGWLVQKIRRYYYSFLHLTSLFFQGFPKTVASFFHGIKPVVENASTYHNKYSPYFSRFVLLAPILFFKKERILKLYSLLVLAYLLFIPYLFCRVTLATRHFTQTVVVSSLFLGLLFHYLFESISRIKVNLLRKILNLLLILFLGIFFLRYMVITKREAGICIEQSSSCSPFIEKFIEEFKKIEINNEKRQIYFLKSDIPNKYSFAHYSYYIFYLAIKYKGLPVDLYQFVHEDIMCHQPLGEDSLSNYFISLSDGSCFGVYRDEDKVEKLIKDNPYITTQDIIVFSWDNGLKQEYFDDRIY